MSRIVTAILLGAGLALVGLWMNVRPNSLIALFPEWRGPRAERSESPLVQRFAPADLTSSAEENRSERVGLAQELAPTPQPASLECTVLRGRVLFPEGTPEDEEVRVRVSESRGRHQPPRRQEESIGVDVEGGFAFDVPPGVMAGFLSIEAHYLTLGVQIVPWSLADDAEREVLIKPELGGRVIARMVRKDGRPWSIRDGMGLVLSCSRPPQHAFPSAADGGTRPYQSPHEPEALDLFELTGVRAGEFMIGFDSPRFIGGSKAPVTVVPGGTAEVTLTAMPGILVEGLVLTHDGQPIPEARVLTRLDGALKADGRTRTGEEGLFVRSLKAEGTYKIEVQAPGFVSQRKNLGELFTGRDLVGLNFILDRGQELSGNLVRSDRGSVAGASVWLLSDDERRGLDGNGSRQMARVGSDGTFSFQGLEPERNYRVYAHLERDEEMSPLVAEAHHISGTQSTLRLVLNEGLTLSGRVVDDSGAPITSFFLGALSRDHNLTPGVEGMSQDWLKSRSFLNDVESADGSFMLRGLTSGKWYLFASAPGHRPLQRHPVEPLLQMDCGVLVLERAE